MKALEPGSPLMDALASRVPSIEAQKAREAIREGSNFTSAHIIIRGGTVNIMDKDTGVHIVCSTKTGRCHPIYN